MAEQRPTGGRPRHVDGPKMPRDEVERLLVEGELVEGSSGAMARVWPSQRELARRFGVAPSLVAALTRERDCARRKAQFQEAAPPIALATTEIRAAPATSEPAPASKRDPGRPRKGDVPDIPYDELDRLLVFGETQQLADGSSSRKYPSHRELGERFGVVPSVIASYAKHHNCMHRREEAASRVALQVEQRMVEAHAAVLSVRKEDALRIIDRFLMQFEQALADGRVRSDNPTDFNTMLRLKELIQGGADSRKQIQVTLSLDKLQERYARMSAATRELAGEEPEGIG